MVITDHAKQRWGERFKNLQLDRELSRAKKPKKKELANIKSQCPNHIEIMSNKQCSGLYYLLSPQGVVFVCSDRGTIVTVFPYCNRGGSRPSKFSTKAVYKQGKYEHKFKADKTW